MSVRVTAIGPGTIAAAARQAEGVDLTAGAEPDRLAHGVDTARDNALGPIEVGAYLNVSVDSDLSQARELVRESVATFARFSRTAAGLSDASGRDVETASDGYEPDHHGDTRASFARHFTDAFIDRLKAIRQDGERSNGLGRASW